MDRATQLANVESDERTWAMGWEQVKKEAKSKEAYFDAERQRLAAVVRARSEPRDVEVVVEADYARGVVEHIRMDNGEIFHSRAMMPEERQSELEDFLVLPGGKDLKS